MQYPLEYSDCVIKQLHVSLKKQDAATQQTRWSITFAMKPHGVSFCIRHHLLFSCQIDLKPSKKSLPLKRCPSLLASS